MDEIEDWAWTNLFAASRDSIARALCVSYDGVSYIRSVPRTLGYSLTLAAFKRLPLHPGHGKQHHENPSASGLAGEIELSS